MDGTLPLSMAGGAETTATQPQTPYEPLSPKCRFERLARTQTALRDKVEGAGYSAPPAIKEWEAL
jgi:hypothetical protein